MPTLKALIDRSRTQHHHGPWPRVEVTPTSWSRAAEMLASGQCDLLGLWGEQDRVHMALREPASGTAGVLSLPCSKGRYPSVSQKHLPALRLERTLADLFGLVPEDLPDTRPWVDHGRWNLTNPLAATPGESNPSRRYGFLPAEGAGLHQIPVGPVHAGIIEPGHFRFSANGETVVRLEERFGYAHKGIEGLMTGATIERAVTFAGRTSGDSTVAYQWAFAMAVEAALGVTAPERGAAARLIVAELERLANHLGDFGAICNDAAFALMHAHTSVLRERVLRAADVAFGHRLMRDFVVPGGVSTDLSQTGIAAVRELLGELDRRLPALIELYDNTASLQDRTVGTGFLSPELAHKYAAGGFVGRASGRDFDVRRDIAYAPYDRLPFDVPALEDGDVNARIWVRIREIGQSQSLIAQILDQLPDGPVLAQFPSTTPEAREGLGMTEGFRGDVLVWLRLNSQGRIERCHLRDPSWFQWPLLEAAIEGNIVADFPLCNKSFNCSYSGVDL